LLDVFVQRKYGGERGIALSTPTLRYGVSRVPL